MHGIVSGMGFSTATDGPASFKWTTARVSQRTGPNTHSTTRPDRGVFAGPIEPSRSGTVHRIPP